MEQIKAGNETAFEALYLAYYVPLCAFIAGYVGTDTVAEELTQDLMCWLWERRTEWKVPGSVRSYLYLSARNRALNSLKHARVTTRLADRWAQEASFAGSTAPGMGANGERADARVRSREMQVALARAIAELPSRCRLVYTLRWHHDLSYAEIANIAGIAVKTVEFQLTKAVRLLNEAIEPFL